MNKLVALIAFAIMLAFLAILMWHVPRLDLGAVVAITVVLATWDLILNLKDKRN